MATRRERVVLDLQDNFTPGMARAAAATALLNRELNSLSGQSLATARSSQTFVRDIDRIGASARGADSSINQLTGRLRLLGEALAILGPTANPLGGAALAGISGLVAQMGAAAVAGGVLVGSLQGVGDALGAMNEAQLKPSNENLADAEAALKRLSPAARNFAEALFDLKPGLVAIRDIGAESLIPGLAESLESVEVLGPRVAGIFQSVGAALGDIASDSAAALSSDRWADFFTFVEQEIPNAITELATTVGSLTHGMAELWEATTPLNEDFSSWLMGVADSFDEWATGLAGTEGFANFIDYVRTTGPQLADTLGAIAGAVIQIVQATAPLGGPVLASLEAAANVIGSIADSDLGTPIFAGVAALAALNRTLAVTSALSKTSLSSGLFAGVGTLQKGIKGQSQSIRADLKDATDGMVAFGANAEKAAAAADRLKGRLATGAGLAGMGVLATGAADGIGLTNTASLALMGTIAGPWGAAIGGGVGLLMDLKAGHDNATASADAFAESLKTMTSAQLLQMEASEKQRLIDEGYGADNANLKAIQEQIEATTLLEATERSRTRAAAISYASQVGLNTDLAKWQRKSAEEIKAQADALAALTKEADETSASFLKFPDSLNKAKVSLGDFLGEMEKNARALANFNTNSLRAARNGLDEGLIASLRKMGTEGALRMQQFASANQEQIERANKAHRSYQRETERSRAVTARLAGMSPVDVKINAQTQPAMKNIAGLEARLRAIRDEDVFINVRQIGATTLGPRPGVADGGTIPGQRTPYGDKHLYWLAPGEEVISNRRGQADRHRSLLKRINADGLADGGTTGRKGDKRKASGGFFAVDNTDSLQAAIDRLTMVSQDQTRALDDATRRTEEWSQRMSDVAQATISGFNTGLFERDSNPWAAGASGGPLANLMRDIAGLNERSGLQSQLAGLGLSGDALAALLGEGTNADIAGLINSGQVSQYAALYNQRAALQGSVGQQAGVAAFGQQQAAALKEQQAIAASARVTELEIVRLNGKVEALTAALANVPDQIGEGMGRALNGAAANGHRDRRNGGGPTRP